MVFNYFLRDDKRSGKKIHMYWFVDNTGKRVQKTCKNPDGSSPCTSKKNAFEYLAVLERAYAVRKKKPVSPLFSEYAEKMFLPGAAHLERIAEHDRGIKEQTRATYRRHIVNILIPVFGTYKIEEITAELVDDELVRLKKPNGEKYSGSFKNGIIYTLNAIFAEAKRDKLISTVPDFEIFARKTRKQDILSDDELEMLFPESLAAVDSIWRPKKPDLREQKYTAYMLCVLSLVAVSAGLRSGEARALHMDQLYPEYRGIIVDRAFEGKELSPFLKKGNEVDERHRVVILPEKTWEQFERFLDVRGRHDGFVFEYWGKPVTQSFLQYRFVLALKNAGIYSPDRKTTFHGLRYTYNTKMRRLVDAETLRDFIGHKSESMTDHYDRPILEQLLKQYQSKRTVIDLFWHSA